MIPVRAGHFIFNLNNNSYTTTMKPSSRILLCNAEFLHVIKIAGHRANLALETLVWVETSTNNTTVYYEVRSWNDRLKRLNKRFSNYIDAYNYYDRLFTRFDDKKPVRHNQIVK